MTSAWFVYMFFAAALVAVGTYALLTQKNLIKMLIGFEVLSKGVSLALLSSGAVRGSVLTAQSLVITFIVIEVSLIATALALVVNVQKQTGALDVRGLSRLKG